MTASRASLRRLSVAYRIGPDDELVPAAPPSADVPARREAQLYRTLARLSNASDAELLATATRFGPLGPLQPITVKDPARYLYFLDWAIRNEHRHFVELRRWLRSWSVLPIRARLAPLATMIVAFAEVDPELTRIIAEIIARDTPTRPQSTGPELWARLMDYQYKVSAKVDIPPPAANEWTAKPDALVSVRVAPGFARQLPAAADLVLSVLEMFEREGGINTLMDPADLGRLAAEVAPYNVARILGLAPPETTDHWRTAANELDLWARALRDLRRLRSAPSRLAVTPPLAQLRAFGGVGIGDATDTVFDSERALASELAALLTLRLQQIGAWPYPAGEIVGAFGRALWSLWRPIKATTPPRGCAWPKGCSVVLSELAHGNRRYCDHHRRLALRERAARNRARNRDQLVIGRGARPVRSLSID